MMRAQLRRMLADYRKGAIEEDELLRALAGASVESIGYASIDHDREARTGYPEVIFCQGKTPAQVAGIARRIARRGRFMLATRADRRHFAAVRKVLPGARFNPLARTISAGKIPRIPACRGTILVVTAGTSDIPVAEEALETARLLGNPVDHLYDVGVAGIHRILAQSQKLRQAAVLVVVAGMEGALASVVGGLVKVPVIAVPTSVGYGASFQGVAALLGMLNSCAAGVTVVNIDNGFGAGYAASLMNRAGA